MEIKQRYGLAGVTIGAVIVLIMHFMGIGSSRIRTGIFAVCAILLPFLIKALQNKIRPGS